MKIVKIFFLIGKSLRYAMIAGKADSALEKKEYRQSLYLFEKADKILPLSGEDLLTRSLVNLRLSYFEESIRDAKNAIHKIEAKKKYIPEVKSYLIYWAGLVGTNAEVRLKNVDQSRIDKDFRRIQFNELKIDCVSQHLQDKYPFVDGPR